MHTDITVPSWVDRTLYPFTPRTFPTRDGRMAYLDEGPRDAPPVLVVHGTPTWSFEWREVVKLIRPHHRVIVPDHLGFGLSDAIEDPARLTPAAHAERLLALVDHLELRDLTLVVHDFGGPIGLPVALDRRERVARVVLLNTWMWPNADDAAVQRIDRMVRSPLGRFLYFTLNVSPKTLLPSAMGDRALLTDQVHAHFLAPFATRASRASLYALACALGGADAYYASLWERRARLEGLPLSIVWGDRDPAFGATQLARWTATFPQAEVTHLPSVGHFGAEEAPHELARVVARADARGRLAPPSPRERRASPVLPRLALAAAAIGLALATAWALWS